MKLIAIDGLDGSGKGTQSRLLEKYYNDRGIPARRIDFPRYGSKSCALIEGYLHGDLGGHPDDTGAYAAATFFAIDRYWSYRTEWESDYKNGTIIIADRYTTANAVHQCSKLPKEEWNTFLDWLWDNEYNKIGIPRPDKIIFLEMRPDVSAKLIENRSKFSDRIKDIHESDREYLDRCYEAALYASDYLGWSKIRCYNADDPRPVKDIFEDILKAIEE
ncbi:MAG: deoxynucleoside kinase [Clostridia bacterium]|nr:deoxynucleoside kinase [Clostridia bacterium]